MTHASLRNSILKVSSEIDFSLVYVTAFLHTKPITKYIHYPLLYSSNDHRFNQWEISKQLKPGVLEKHIRKDNQ